ncbi:condensation domain-containing protein [Streptomyces naphthomycinicus]|uniref:condensation domain-containing protein n=1 Tax=Streptomyces naphthomycinicus TaxID=2872625 RepID=UPI001CED0B14|nr:condensation domain-containing protein [Streptomyces sp. TML10]
MSQTAYVLPASFGQERLWLLDQLRPGSALHNLTGGLRLTGELDEEALRRSLRDIVARHEVLRTVLRLDGDRVVQDVLESIDTPLRVVAPAEGPDGVDAVIRRLDAEPFDLATAPLIRCHLIRSGPREQVLLLVMHHAIGDGHSIEVLLAELAHLYSGHAAGLDPELPELPLQYADFAVWQRETFESGALDEQIGHWRRELSGIQPLRLPLDRPRPARPTHVAEVDRVAVPADVVKTLTALGSGATPFMVAVAGYAALLTRWSGQPDVVVGFPSLGRDQGELLDLVGFFINTVPLRIPVDAGQSFADLLSDVRRRCLAANANSGVPFEKLVESLSPERVVDRSPLAQAWINLQQPHGSVTMKGLTGEPLALPMSQLPFDVVLDVKEENGGLAGNLGAAADVFTPETVRRAARAWEELLAAAAENPAALVSELPCPLGPATSAAVAAQTPAAADDGDSTPSTKAEALIAGLWAEIFEDESISVDQGFYALGGNSLRAVRVITRARELGLELPIEVALGEHTIRQLAAEADDTSRS